MEEEEYNVSAEKGVNGGAGKKVNKEEEVES